MKAQVITLITVIITLLVLLLLAACGNKRAASRRGTQAAILPPAPVIARRSLTPLPLRPLSAQWQELRAEVMRDTSAARGLDWKNEVGMTELSGWEYGTRTKEIAKILGGDDLNALSKLAIAGGMLPEGTDLASLAVSFTAASAGATYSPLDRQVLLLQAEKKSPAVTKNKSLLAHEFVHALQDQHFDLLKMLLVRPFNFDRTEAAFALVEGDAMNVQRRQETGEAAWNRRGLEEIARQEDERFSAYRKGIGSWFPPLLTETFIFRYRDGARFVEAMRRHRSAAMSADDLFQRPPASSEQVLHPEKYIAQEAPREVEVNEQHFATEQWRLSAATTLGEIGVRGVLMAGVATPEASRAAAGWGGDRAYVFEREGHVPLFVWKTSWDKREDAQEFLRAYNALQKQQNKTEVKHELTDGEGSAWWRENNLLTLVRFKGDTVVIIRGTEADIHRALELMKS